MTATIIITYLICALLSYSMLIADFDDQFGCIDRRGRGMALLVAVLLSTLGPLGLFIVFCMTGFAKAGLKF